MLRILYLVTIDQDRLVDLHLEIELIIALIYNCIYLLMSFWQRVRKRHVCQDCSGDVSLPLTMPPRQPTDLPPPSPQEVLDNRGRGRTVTAQAPPARRRSLRQPPHETNGQGVASANPSRIGLSGAARQERVNMCMKFSPQCRIDRRSNKCRASPSTTR